MGVQRYINFRNLQIFFYTLLQKNEENCHDQAKEGRDVVPLEGLTLEHDGDHDGEDGQ